MSYVHVSAGVIDSGELARPDILIRESDGARVVWSEYITPDELAECGWFQVVTTDRPADTPTTTADRSVTIVAGVPTETWTPRPKTQIELTNETRAANQATLADLTAVTTAITNLKTFLVDPDVQVVLDVANTTALTTQQTNRALKAIIRQLRRDANFDLRLARYVLGAINPTLLDDISDTTGAG